MTLPLGIKLFVRNRYRTIKFYRISVLILTYLTYVGYHQSRRSFSIVKNVLHCDNNNNNNNNTNTNNGVVVTNVTTTLKPPPILLLKLTNFDNNNNDEKECQGWPPFDQDNYKTLYSLLDSCFLFAYAIGMFFAGFIAERNHLRYFLTIGMLLSGLLNIIIGFAYYLKIHSLTYFIVFQIISGIVQTSGWPAVVASVGSWYESHRAGVMFGIWNTHTNVGNILGAVLAGAFVEQQWGLSYMVPGLLIIIFGFLIFLFLVPNPHDAGIELSDKHAAHLNINDPAHTNVADPNSMLASADSGVPQRDLLHHNNNNYRTANTMTPSTSANDLRNSENDPLLQTDDSAVNFANLHDGQKPAISFWKAVKIPGVLEFSVCLFFAKLVSYTFLYWLPFYIKHATSDSSSISAFISSAFDVGGVIGGITAGLFFDLYGTSAIVCTVMLAIAFPLMVVYYYYGVLSHIANIALLILCGIFVNGPYALITTAVSAELGSKVESSEALATVVAIIDGTGSLGAAIGPLLSGPLAKMDWIFVFAMIWISLFLASISLLRIARSEYRRFRNR